MADDSAVLKKSLYPV